MSGFDADLPPAARAWTGFAILCVVAVFALVDRQVLSLVAEPLREALELTDTQLGIVQGVGLLFVAAIASFPIGWLADHGDRRVVLGCCVLIWAAATAACAFANHFGTLLAACCGIGIGEAGIAPICYSMFPDLVSEKQRAIANQVFITVCILGAAAGLEIGGSVLALTQSVKPFLPAALSDIAPWRLTLIIVAAPAPILVPALATIRLRRRVARTEVSRANGSPPELISHVKAHRRAVFGVFIATACFCAALGAALAWAPVMMVRTFAQTPVVVGAALGASIGVGSLVGLGLVIAATWFLRGRYGRLLALRISIGAFLFAIVPTTALLFARTSAQGYLCLAALFACSLIANSESPTILQDLAPPSLRGRLVALCVIAGSAAQGLSPVLVGRVSDLLTHNPRGLQVAIVVCSLPFWAAAAAMMAVASRTFPRAAVGDAVLVSM